MIFKAIMSIIVLAVYFETIQLGGTIAALPSDLAVLGAILLVFIASYIFYKLQLLIWR